MRCEEFVNHAENVMQIICDRQIIPYKKLFHLQLRLANRSYCFRTTQVFTIDFWFCPKFIDFNYFLFSKTIQYELREVGTFRHFPDILSVLFWAGFTLQLVYTSAFLYNNKFYYL